VKTPKQAEVVIVGAGFAGAATAYALHARGVRGIVLLEQETRPGLHSSGRNAAMGRQIVTDPDLLRLAVEGMRFLTAPPVGFPQRTYLKPTGALLVASGAKAEAYRSALPLFEEHRLRVNWLEHSEVVQLVQPTDGGAFEGGVHCLDDGVVDVAALLESYLKVSGARIFYGRRLAAVETAGGRVVSVDTDHRERIETPIVVNAAGAWAGEVAALAQASPLPLRPTRRHLVVTGPLGWVEPSWPFVWDLSHDIYFRPEPPGLLLSPCDQTDHPPGDASVDDCALGLLAEKLEKAFPRLSDLPVQSTWAGHRTLLPDGRFAIGPDPRLAGFFWCAGLGGHGVTTSAAAGRLAAEAVLDGSADPGFTPARFVAPEETS
jgi:D-arginine dehydrogenase